ncbi:alpha/beta fold hydrolase [Thalassobacillus sp. C254]|uniref:alpha/beta fold hydrolase n=1 Tax=Thalassobacillus sp. C254 TaxID=1225341 RepID=UPI0018DECA33|nr:alpha/beta hydrolase [Thalassobacillus sp. C254]
MLHYYRRGTGDPLLLLHGFLSTNRVFDKIIPELEKKYDIIAPDLPGHGKSLYNGEETIDEYKDAIIELLHSLNIKKATWAGHSMGGYITMAAVEKAPSFVKRAAFLYSSPAADTEKDKEQRDQNIQLIQNQGLQVFINQKIPDYFSFDADPQAMKEAFHHAKQATKEGVIAAIQAMKNRKEQVTVVNEAPLPLLFIEGNKDLVEQPFPVSSRWVEKAKTESSHMGMLENPEDFLKKLTRWLVATY